ncbi:MAG: aminomethyl transferase family protein, partial [Rhodobacteraceae bacterium]|nr:aminomethyl transferase family protein [Paracoccaceae bacterium]
YFCDSGGRVVTEMSVARMAEDRFILITAATAQWHDFDWLSAHLPKGLTLTDISAEWSCQILTGPRAREVLAPVAEADLTLPWLSHQEATIAGHPCWLVRVSYAGELGWEIHSRLADTPAIFDAVQAAGAPLGLKPFGMYALDRLRLEKGYRAWKGDLSTDYTVLESGLGRFVKLDKPGGFLGRDALAAEAAAGPKRRFATLVLEDCPRDAPSMAPVSRDGTVVGEVTSCGFGYRVGRLIALAVLRADCAEPGTILSVEIHGQPVTAMVQDDAPLWDPGNARIRA